MLIKSISDYRRAVRNGPYAWPGGYPVYFLMADGEACSFNAIAKECRREVLTALASGSDEQWTPIALEINWEDGNLICAHTNERIESAYAEPE